MAPDLIDALKRLRDEGRVPWEWITDETRTIEDYTGYQTVKQGVLTTLPGIGLNPWHYSPPLILTESRSLAGVLRAVASEYRVRIASTNGQVGGFLHTDVAPLLQAADTVGYLGDYDLAGGQIEANTRRVLERKIDGELNWTRIALTAQQVEQYDLPSIAKRDKRYEDGHPHEAVETEAIGQGLLIEILQAWLERQLPEPLSRVQERETRQRKRLANRLRGRQ